MNIQSECLKHGNQNFAAPTQFDKLRTSTVHEKKRPFESFSKLRHKILRYFHRFLKDYENKQSEEDTTQERTCSETNKTRKKNESPAKKRGMPIVATLAVGSATKKEKEFSSTRKPPIYEGKK